MQNPIVVLKNLSSHSRKETYKFKRLYRNLYNIEFYKLAYDNIYAKEGNMTEGTDGQTVDGVSTEKIEKLIEHLRDCSYQPNPSRRTYIKKKNGKQRPLGIPSFIDKLVQEVIRLILEAIYEPNFADTSHGFRPKRSCHTALEQIVACNTGIRWWIEGDIKGFFDNINHHKLIGILRRRIADEKFLHIVWKFLRAGYLEDWTFNMTYSGTPQGGIISPILANIYLNELDIHMKKFKERFDKGKGRRMNPAYTKLQGQVIRRKKKLQDANLTAEERERLTMDLQNAYKKQRETTSRDPMDSTFKRITYTRYADDFLIGIHGSKEEAEIIKTQLANFLMKELSLELSIEKTLITSGSKNVRFLGYDLVCGRSNQLKTVKKKDGTKHVTRTANGKIFLHIPYELWTKKLMTYGALNITKEGKWKIKHRPYLKDIDDLEIISIVNAQIRGFFEYYKIAHNVGKVMNSFKYLMEYSMYKTYGNKYKISVPKVKRKFNVNGKFGVKYDTKKQKSKVRLLIDISFARRKTDRVNPQTDSVPNINKYLDRTSYMDRLAATSCAICNVERVPLEMHHVRKVKDLKGKKWWERIMIERKRKMIPVCERCHDDIHAGRLD